MQITNEQVVDFANMNVKTRKFPVRLLYALAMNGKSILPALTAYSESREELIKKHAKKDDDGNAVVNETGNYEFEDVEAWNKDIKELLESKAEIPVTTIPMSVIEKCDQPEFESLSFDDMNAIRFMIEG